MPPKRVRGDRAQGHEDQISREDDDNLLRTRQPLSPEGLWFDNPDVVQTITKDIKSHYEQPCTCWRNAPTDHKEFWWRAFKGQFTWDDELDKNVYKEWRSKASDRLRDIVCKAMAEDITPWMPVELKKRVQAFRETPEFKRRSDQNKKNKTTGPNAGTLHTTGSISASQWARRMAKRNGERPSASEVFVQIHTRKDGNERVFCDKRSKTTWDEFERLKLNASQSGSEVDEDDLFLQAAGGFTKKGTVYGLGKESSSYYTKKPLGESSSVSTYTPSVVSQMKTSLQETKDELDATKGELQATKDQLQATKGELHELLRATQDEQRQQRELIASLIARLDGSSSQTSSHS